jgi:hypothetical protein
MVIGRRFVSGELVLAPKMNLIWDMIDQLSRNQRAAYFVDEKAPGAPGGTFTSGAWRTRVLNTERWNDGSYYELASNQITIPAGRYRAIGYGMAYQVGWHRMRLFDMTNNVALGYGTSHYAGTNIDFVDTARIDVYFELTDDCVVQLQHRCYTTKATVGFGGAAPSGFGVNEQYAVLALQYVHFDIEDASALLSHVYDMGNPHNVTVDQIGELPMDLFGNYTTNDIDEEGAVIYVGMLKSNDPGGAWVIKRIIDIDGYDLQIRYASGQMAYQASWADRVNLVYQTSDMITVH